MPAADKHNRYAAIIVRGRCDGRYHPWRGYDRCLTGASVVPGRADGDGSLENPVDIAGHAIHCEQPIHPFGFRRGRSAPAWRTVASGNFRHQLKSER
jgi:hypothetical protein